MGKKHYLIFIQFPLLLFGLSRVKMLPLFQGEAVYFEKML
jgi:hypothetical protein